MGQKINPNGLRLGVNKTWDSRWFSKNAYVIEKARPGVINSTASFCVNINLFIFGSVNFSGNPFSFNPNQNGSTEPLLCATLANLHTANLFFCELASKKHFSIKYFVSP